MEPTERLQACTDKWEVGIGRMIEYMYSNRNIHIHSDIETVSQIEMLQRNYRVEQKITIRRNRLGCIRFEACQAK